MPVDQNSVSQIKKKNKKEESKKHFLLWLWKYFQIVKNVTISNETIKLGNDIYHNIEQKDKMWNVREKSEDLSNQ